MGARVLAALFETARQFGNFWYKIVRPCDWPWIFSANLRQWLASNLHGGHSGSEWPHIFGSAVYDLNAYEVDTSQYDLIHGNGFHHVR